MILATRRVEAASISLVWDPNPEPTVVGYAVYYGTSSGAYTTILDVGAATSTTVTGLTDGQLYYFAVDAYTADGTRSPKSAEITGIAGTSAVADLTSPTPGSTLSGSSATFQWSPGAGVTSYRLSVGTAVGGVNLFDVTGSSRSQTVTGLPTNGSTIYVRLWSLLGGTWRFTDYTFIAATPAQTRIIGLSGSLAFSNTQVGSTSTKTLTIANTGNALMTVTSIAYPAGFSGSWSGTIAAGASRAVTVTFTPTAVTSYSGTVQVNANQTSGTATISASGTGTTPPPSAPTAPVSPTPAAGATGVSRTPTLTWTSTGATTYDVKLGTTNPPATVTTGLTAASYAPATLNSGTTYYWQVIARNAGGSATSSVWSFTTVAATVTSASVLPASGSGATQTFALQYGDTLGATDLSTAWVWFNATFGSSSANSCLAYYDRTSNLMYLLNDAGATYATKTVGASGTLQNSQCSIAMGSSTTVALSGSTLTLNLAVTFTPAFGGAKNVYMYAANPSGANSAWQARGTWTVPGPALNAPGSPSGATPANGATGQGQSPTLSWSSTGATSYDVKFGTSNPPPTVTTNQSGASYSPTGLSTGTTYYWQVIARNATGSTTGSVWSFATALSSPGGLATVTANSVSPASGSGATQTFALQYGDTLGATDLATAWVWINSTFGSSSANSCLAYYDRTANVVNLLNDAGTAYSGGAIGSGGTLQNSQCAIALGSGTTASVSGNTLTLNLALTFTSGFGGSKNVYMFAASPAGANSAWQSRGAWTVPGSSAPGSAPGAPSGMSPANGATGQSQSSTLSWSSTGATSYDVKFGLSNPPPTVTTGQTGASYSPSALSAGATYFWQVVARNASGSTASSVWSFTTATSGGGAAVVTANSVSPVGGSGAAQTFTMQFANTAGATDLSAAWVWINTSFGSNAARSCLVYYDRAANVMNLLNDAGTAYTTGTVGGGSTLTNGQCALALGSGTTASISGTTLTLNLAMTFTPGFGGTKNVYMFAASPSGANSGWQARGAWTVPGSTPGGGTVVTANSATPASGGGATQTFALQFGDTAGATDLATNWVWFNTTLSSSSANSCLMYYDRSSNMLNLLNDAGTAYTSRSVGSSGTLQNSKCSIAMGSSTTVAVSGNTLTLNLAMTFTPAFSGAKNIFMFASNSGGLNSGWMSRGTWTVP